MFLLKLTRLINDAVECDYLYGGNPGTCGGGPVEIDCEAAAGGRFMTGGGSVTTTITPISVNRVAHGFHLLCDDLSHPSNNLEVSWSNGATQNNFHLTALTSASCIDVARINPGNPRCKF